MRAVTFLVTIGLLGAFTTVLVLVDGSSRSAGSSGREANIVLVRTLRLTDLSLWTEARYTRHPSQADLFTPFQTAPSALEHFPSGSWVPPGRGLRRGGRP